MASEISAKDLAGKISKGKPIHLVDVRDPWERAIAILPDQQHIPLGELPERMGEIKPPKGSLLVLYCHHGVRSLAGASFLEDQGWKGVASLQGGIDAWSNEVDSKIPVY